MKNNHTPDIRFPEYTGGWEERKLGDVSERVRGNDGRMNLPTLTISAGSGWLDQRERFSGNIAGKEQKNYTLLSKGELSYNHGNSKLAKYGVVFELRTYEEALVPRVYHSFKTTEEASPDFIEYMFATKIPDRELAKLISSGARMDGLLNINYDEFMSIKIIIPKVEEQMKIAKFLRRLDDTIALYQKELTTLKQTKQGFLQKMFPKEGESVPEVRFPGFTEDWKISKLSDMLSSLKSGLSRMLSNQDIGLPVIRANNISNGILDIDNDIKYWYIDDPQGANTQNYLIQKNDILVNFINSEAKMGTAAIAGSEPKRPTIYTTNILNLRTNQNANPYFIYTLTTTEKYKNYIKTITKPAVNQASFTTVDFKRYEFLAPTIKEQIKIGNFFKEMDDLIALHQRELDNLKETKKAFLQKMFT
ncbi:restriction endonuclease subunit S [Priestia megaterium]|uniref:restriction endonuclease subunit S n=1 Tax=Priestia megaterium TaxID=1404 RepID=UPI002E1C3929|nr:restriction endonuclease subunit S [Priestia megaterium]MED4760216.1 restriction endonuclease subunit S [Priestia megaterium]